MPEQRQTVRFARLALPVLVLALAWGGIVLAEDDADPSLRAGGSAPVGAGQASDEELEKLVAPVALYPDPLLAQVLDGSQHPRSLVAAGDFLQAPEGAKTLDKAWPASVKALLDYPDVLLNMDGNLSWTVRLGSAADGQAEDLDEAVQYVRHQALKAGNLKTTDQQLVKEEGDRILILPAEKETIYVPYYDPAYIYVPGAYYGGYGWTGAPLLTFGAGVLLGHAITHHRYVHGGYPHYHWRHPHHAWHHPAGHPHHAHAYHRYGQGHHSYGHNVHRYGSHDRGAPGHHAGGPHGFRGGHGYGGFRRGGRGHAHRGRRR